MKPLYRVWTRQPDEQHWRLNGTSDTLHDAERYALAFHAGKHVRIIELGEKQDVIVRDW